MDESRRMRTGLNLPRRRSTEETSSDRMRRNYFNLDGSDSETLNPDDFHDVFGGPPRTLLSRRFSGDLRTGNRSDSFYEEIFRSPDSFAPPKNGRNLPVFSIPATRGGGVDGNFRRNVGFYDDIFGFEGDRRSRSRSKSKSNSKPKSNSSSVLSSENLSPLRPSIADGIPFSFASKLRSIDTPCQRNPPPTVPKEQQKRHGMSAIPCPRPSYVDFQFMENNSKENLRRTHFEFSQQVSSPETNSVEPNSYQRIKIYDLETDSPSSAVSSIFSNPEAKARIQEKALHEQEDDEIMSSFIIEITYDKREGINKAVAVDEAILWAKEKFLTQSSEELESRNQQHKFRTSPFAEKEGPRRIQ